ncbi:heterodisulfide reductase-related iron-sulfur binding cluster [Corynebacterium suicordis]
MNLLAAGTATSNDIPWDITIPMGIIGALLSLPAWVFFIRGALRIFSTIRIGQPALSRVDNPAGRLLNMIKEILGHTKMAKKPGVAIAHWMVMVGFLLGSIVWFEAYIQIFNPEGGWPIFGGWGIYHFVDELLGIATVLGIIALIIIRQRIGDKEKKARFYGSYSRAAYFVEAVVLVEGLGMIFVKASKIATFASYEGGHAATDFLTMHIAQILPESPLLVSIFAMIKLLSGMIWLFIVGLNIRWGVAWHRFLAFFNIFLKRNSDGRNALGAAKPMTSQGRALTMENADPETDTIGAGKMEDFTWKGIMDFTSCTECGRCQEQCPAWHTAKPLSPKLLIMDLRDHTLESAPYLKAARAGTDAQALSGGVDVLEADASTEAHSSLPLLQLVGEGEMGVIDPDVLWSCTNCGACVEQCPVDIEHIDHIIDMRRYQVLVESDFPTELGGLFKNMETKGNPWGQNNNKRAEWIEKAKSEGIDIPVYGQDIENFDDTEYLFWVGCAGVYDDNATKTTRAVADLLHTAGVKFAVLGEGEGCTGDSARRAGNEFLFQMLAEQNIEMLDQAFEGVPPQQRKIVVTCAHCFNTLRNEYPDMGGNYEVVHHTQLLNKLIRENRLQPVSTPNSGQTVTYHDPCFLGRHNKIFEAPRELIGASGANLVEMDRNRNTGFCCGAGGARMWMEEHLGERINLNRTDEALATGSDAIAIGCPFCKTMMSDGVNTRQADIENKNERTQVLDIAQMFRSSILVEGELPPAMNREFLVAPERGWVDEEKLAREEAERKAEAEAKRRADEEKKRKAEEKKAADAKKAEPAGSAGVPAPGAAAAPSAPGAPVAPAAGAPAAPSAPGAPTAPKAAAPAAPGAPSAPSASAPGAPAAPKAPSAPGAPGAPSAPAAPVAQAPTKAEKPAESPAPQTQSAPVPATNAGGPIKLTSTAPGAPGAPSSSAPAAAPVAPAAATSPNVPSVPGTPNAPSTPGTQAPAQTKKPAEKQDAQAQSQTAPAPAPASNEGGPIKLTSFAPGAPGAPGAPAATAPATPASTPAPAAPAAPEAAESKTAVPETTEPPAKETETAAPTEAESLRSETPKPETSTTDQTQTPAASTSSAADLVDGVLKLKSPGAPGAPGAPKA